jgi:hypothetical protein
MLTTDGNRFSSIIGHSGLSHQTLAMTNLLIRHRVSEFSSWKSAFDAHANARADAGLKDREVMRDLNDPNQVVLLFEVSDVRKAKEFCESLSLREAMQGAGVIDRPDLYFLGH